MPEKKNRPNILCFITDQQRADHLGCMGNSIVRTPNIDHIAKIGVLFQRAYVSNPLCMPARATLFTGRTPRGHLVRTNGIPLSRDIPTMVEALRQSGYRTHSIGKLHLNTFDTPRGINPEALNPYDFLEARWMWINKRIRSIPTPYYGFETVEFVGGHVDYVFGDYLNWLKENYPEMEKLLLPENALEKPSGADQYYKMALPEELHYNRWISDRAIKFLEKVKDSQPFFLWCSFPDPHHPYSVSAPWCYMYDPKDIPLPVRREGELEDLPPFYKKIYEEGAPLVSGLRGPSRMPDEHIREIIALTYGMISFVDNEIGRIMKRLEDLGLRENTVVIFMSDHGDMMGDHWMIRKGPFHFDGLLKIPFIWSFLGNFLENKVITSLVSQIDFAPTILDICNVPIPEGRVPGEPEAPEMLPPWPGKSLREILEGKVDKVNDYVIVENDEDYLGLRLRTFITDNFKITIYPGHSYGELFDLKNDPQELYNLWWKPEYQEIKKRLILQFAEAYILQESTLPRRLCHA
ncbi:MAG: sulfatase-like hydrolase/transferase [archaeon YNP-WB-062]|nr:sulfatase-like hydrolase/transferase [Candidatus Culexarchaeum yellowstonense]